MLNRNTLVLLFAFIILTSCVTRKTTMPIIVAPEHSHTERTETIAPDGSYSVRKETRVIH